MSSDTLYTQTHCDRCKARLRRFSRTVSYFKDETICSGCGLLESILKGKLLEKGVDLTALEGCGYIPEAIT